MGIKRSPRISCGMVLEDFRRVVEFLFGRRRCRLWIVNLGGIVGTARV